MRDGSEPSAQRRRLGRSRPYDAASLPPRLRHWHAPRANRWEHLLVETGTLGVAWLEAGGVREERLAVGAARWIAPGTRWRVEELVEGARFLLDIWADDAVPAAAPQALRAELLDAAPVCLVAAPGELEAAVAALRVGERQLLRAGFHFGEPLVPLLAADPRLTWHPLELGAEGCAALIARGPAPMGLADYLGRDHAVIEAVLAGALRGSVEHGRWLGYVLARHLAIEEELLFPAWREAGGREGWIQGLRNEHRHLRADLGRLGDPVARRRFLLLLDGHDEKEEQIVYPDIVAKLGDGLDGLTRRVLMFEG